MGLKIAYPQTESQTKENYSNKLEVNFSKNIDDSELWKSFQSGSDTAYATIYKTNVSLLYNYGFKIVNDKVLIMDCIQDLFVEIWDSKERLGNVKSIKSYLIKSFRRKLIAASIKKMSNIKPSKFQEKLALETVSFEHSLIEKQNFELQRILLKQTMEKLTDKQREVIHLRFYGRLTYIEISEIMSISVKATYKLMGRTIKFLRKNMEV